MTVVTTSPKGQVVIPKREREKIGIKPGSKVAVEVVNDHIEIHPLPDDPAGFLCGIFKDYHGSLTGELLKERKKEIENEEAKSSRFIRRPRLSKKRK
jgi:AbrB family looped-hinge helix DNA binding protein